MRSPLYDAHNHFQDDRLLGVREQIGQAIRAENIRHMVVNGSSEEDWPAVLELARSWPEVIPSFGYHPWYVRQRTGHWQQKLEELLELVPSAVGEIGLDRWVRDHDMAQQEEVFLWQWRLAARRNLPVSIHCLEAWGRLAELVQANAGPECGFVLHSFGGPKEMIPMLAKLGAYFSLPGYFAHERKTKQREAFRHVPLDRLLIETDAPDQSLPPERVRYPLPELEGRPVNHPANLGAVYAFASEFLEIELSELVARVESNFKAVFRPVLCV
jgi:TatD DNase family protein